MNPGVDTRTRSPRVQATCDLLAWLTLALRSVDAESVQYCVSVSPRDLLQEAGGGRIECEPLPSGSNDPSVLTAELHPEYVRLFVANRDAEAAHLEALAWVHEQGPAVRTRWIDRIRAAADRLGVEVEAGSPYPIDHLTILFELLYLEEPDGVEALRESPIWSELIAPWMPAFLERLRQLRPHRYYGIAADVLGALSGPEIASP